jgi:hypothetical protein
MWGVNTPSVRKLGDEWVEFPKLVFDVGNTSFKFYRHGGLFGSMRCDQAINKWTHYKSNDLKLPVKVTGWWRQAFTFYDNCYNTAVNIKRELDNANN